MKRSISRSARVVRGSVKIPSTRAKTRDSAAERACGASERLKCPEGCAMWAMVHLQGDRRAG
jgi:hypothetical protein